MATGPQIALLIETSTTWGTRLVEGIAEFAKLNGPWFFYLEPRGRYEHIHLPTGWRGDGIIARVPSEQLAKEISATGIPAVNVSWFSFGDYPIPRCTVDEAMCGQLAAQHFLERAFKNFGYCGSDRRPGYRDLVRESFAAALKVAGYDCSSYRAEHTEQDEPPWQEQLTGLVRWLESLPKPAAVLAWSDVRGRQITEACQYAGIRVPDDVAVLGGELDELMGAVSHPPLSTIDTSGRKVGFAAADLLSRMLSGQSAPEKPDVIQPNGVITRQSTDTMAIDDDDIARAIGFIREHAHQGIQVGDIVRQSSLSRRVLEQRFKSLIGRSPAAEIRRVRLDRAQQLLIESTLSIPQVASASGFNEPESMTRTFRREFGMTPSAIRRNARPR